MIKTAIASLAIALLSTMATATETQTASKETARISQAADDACDAKALTAKGTAEGVQKTKNCCTGEKCSDKAYCDSADCKCKRKANV